MKIIRIKNRLALGTNDILINVRFCNSITAEVQLKVNSSSSESNFSSCSFNFSHFIYELERSHFGPITEMCSIWMNLDQRASCYSKLVHQDNKLSKNANFLTFSCAKTSKQHNLDHMDNTPFICSECKMTYASHNYIIPHLRCTKCQYWKCSLCIIKQRQRNGVLC